MLAATMLTQPSGRNSGAESAPSVSPVAAGLTAIGIVYGDLGTSPLYTLQTIAQAMGGTVTAESG